SCTVLTRLILKPRTHRIPAGLAAVAAVEAKSATASGAPLPISYADLKVYQARNDVFSSLAGYTTPRGVTWQSGAASQGMFSELVTSNYFSTLGLSPVKGRFFLPEEDGAPGAHPVAVMNYGTWQTRFGGAEDIVGRMLRLNNIVFTVIGVAPPNFTGVNAIFGPDLWIPAAMTEQLLPNQMRDVLSDRSKAVFQGVGRFKPGIARAQADADLAAIASELAREFPAANEGRSATIRPIRDVIFARSSGGFAPLFFCRATFFGRWGRVVFVCCVHAA